MIISIDGHSSTGKSTVAKQLAKKLNYTYIDSGAMYRAVTLFALQNSLISDGEVNEAKLKELMYSIDIQFVLNERTNQQETVLNGKVVESEIRNLEVSENVSVISTIGFVRAEMVRLQRILGEKGNIIMDGRDIGTKVFPDADLKIFMTASAEIRAQRRYKELVNKGEFVTFAEILENVQKRDHIDSTREIDPLRQADDAILLDNSNLTHEEQLSWILSKIENIKNK